jgi:hypothetical protein
MQASLLGGDSTTERNYYFSLKRFLAKHISRFSFDANVVKVTLLIGSFVKMTVFRALWG